MQASIQTLEQFIEEQEYQACIEHCAVVVSIDAGLINSFYELVKDKGIDNEDGLYRVEDLQEVWKEAEMLLGH